MKHKLAALIIFSMIFLFNIVFAADAPQVEMFSPQGTVKGVRQVTVRFSEQMVPFGDPRSLIDPFEISCSQQGSSRWADAKNWIYDFANDIPAGIKCDFKLKEGLKTLLGSELNGQKVFSFSTGGPAILRSMPYEGSASIDEEQIFILTLDAEPDMDSIKQHVTFSVSGLQEQVGVKLIEGKVREKIMQAKFQKQPTQPVILIQSKQRFPSKAKVSLIWGKGVQAKTGVETSQDQIMNFETRSPFMVEFRCERENAQAGCVPLLPMSLNFSAPISKAQANKIVLRSSKKKTWKLQVKKDDNANSYFNIKGPFPENTNFSLEIPRGFKDDAGRALVNADKFPLAVRTEKYPVLAKFAARFGILEKNAQPLLPVTVRNIESQLNFKSLRVNKDDDSIVGKIMAKVYDVKTDRGENLQPWLRKVAAASRSQSIFNFDLRPKSFVLPKPHESKAFEVIGIPLEKPGLYVVEMESLLLGKSLLGSSAPIYVSAAVLVTNLSAHFKWGRESSMIWVTTLDKAAAVWEADVTIRDCADNIIWKGKTDFSGIARIDKQLPGQNELPHCELNYANEGYYNHDRHQLSSLRGGLFVTVQTADDMTFVHSSWQNGIEPWRFQLPEETYTDPVVAHTIFDRTLLRAGETVHMKHVLRQHTTKGFNYAPQTQLPQTISIIHYGSDQKYEFPLKWDGRGIAETVWKIPREAKLGSYGVLLLEKEDSAKKKRKEWQNTRELLSGGFHVEEFRVPLMKAIIQPPAASLIRAKDATLDLSVQYLAGGGAGNLPVKIRSEIRPKYVSSLEGFDDFTFSNGAVAEGIVRRGGAVEYDEYEGESEGVRENEGSNSKSLKLPAMDIALDASGTARANITNLPQSQVPSELLAEMEFADPNGEIQTVSTRIPLWNSKYLIGIKPDSWVTNKDNFKFQVAVLDLKGKPVAETQVLVSLLERKNYSHRKRLVGGFYAYENSVETKKIGTICEGKTDSRGLLICQAKSPVAGNVILQAEAVDDEGRSTIANRDVWVSEKGRWWFDLSDNDRIDLLPEKKRYEPGEKAKFQVRMPFREATALISVEREGIIDSWVKKLSGDNPVIEVPIKGNYAPNVYVSALVVRGRIGGIEPTSMVDLGKPAYKLGIAEINVGWKSHELKLSISTDQKVYKVRQKAKVKIAAATADGKAPPNGTEVAVAVVDEGLLELKPNLSWEILPAMMGRRGYAINTATAQMQVIGKRHFGLKALAQGGGGGRRTTRELFDTLLLWKGRVILDATGTAMIEVPLNDSITSFRIVAVATGGSGLFGTGSASIRSTQDLMILSGLAPVMREGDRYKAGFTVRNASLRNMDVLVSAEAKGMKTAMTPLNISLASGEAKEIGWDVVAPAGVESLLWEVELKDTKTNETDRIKVAQKVVPVTQVNTYQATITQLDKKYRLAVERPADAETGRGGVKTVFKAKISDGLSGVTDYMRRYPYTCMEQRISVAVALRDLALWNESMAKLPSHLDYSGLVRYFPSNCCCGSPALTSYIIAIADEAGWTIQDDTREKMEAGLKNFIEGKNTCSDQFPTADLNIRKLAAIEALSREKKADASMLSSITLEPNLWPTSAVIDWMNILQNVAAIPDRQKKIKEAEQVIRSRLNFQGTKMGFSTEGTDCLWWLMVSNDVNAVRVLLTLMNEDKWQEDMPRLALGALGRQKKGHWDLTLANAWGVLAMEKFSKKYESIPVTGISQVNLLEQTKSIDWKLNPKGKQELLPWPSKKEELVVTHKGTGKPWVTIQSLAAIPLKEPFSSGYKIKKTIIPVDQKHTGSFSKGDIIRVRLELAAQADQTWVVVNDPIPAGAIILGKGLAGDSQILTSGEKKEGWVWPAFEERSMEAFRAYYEYVPKGNWTVEYTVRLNQTGKFSLPTTRVEAMYFPEMLGEMPNKAIEVLP